MQREAGASGRNVPLIAIVDDDESVRDSLRSLIRSVGFRAEVFASAEEFLESRQPNQLSCLILDVRMPQSSGLDLQRLLAKEERSVPIIFITAHVDDVAREAALQAGAVAFLYKPFTADALLHAVRSAVNQSTKDHAFSADLRVDDASTDKLNRKWI